MLRLLILTVMLGQAHASDPVVDDEKGVSEAPPVVEELAVGEPEKRGKTAYTLDASSSSLKVIIRNDISAMMSKYGHDHVIVATNPSGTIEWDPSGQSPCSVSISVPTSGLTADPPGMREKVGLDNRTISASQMEDMMSNMHGKRQLHSSVFPSITYQATSCSGVEGNVVVDGVMTIHGVGKQFTLPMNVSSSADEFKASGTVTLSHADFGFAPFSALMGGLRNMDALEFQVNVHGTVAK